MEFCLTKMLYFSNSEVICCKKYMHLHGLTGPRDRFYSRRAVCHMTGSILELVLCSAGYWTNDRVQLLNRKPLRGYIHSQQKASFYSVEMSDVRLRRNEICYVTLLFFLNVHTVIGVWPKPQIVATSMEQYSLNPGNFKFQYASNSAAQLGCSVLDAAFKRYYSLIFPDYNAGRPADHFNKS